MWLRTKRGLCEGKWEEQSRRKKSKCQGPLVGMGSECWKNRRESGDNELPEVKRLLTQDLSERMKSDVILAVE